MKRSAVFDEVIESGQNCFLENGHASADRKNSSDRENSDDTFAPHYEILRFEGNRSPLGSPFRVESPMEPESPRPSSAVQMKKKNKKRNKNKKKRKSKEKVSLNNVEDMNQVVQEDEDQSGEVTTTTTSSAGANGNAKRIKLIFGPESCTIDIPPPAFLEPSSPDSH